MKESSVFSAKLKSAQRFKRLLGDPAKMKGLRSGLVTLRPREAVGEHKTEGKEEIIVILKGSADIYYGKSRKIRASQDTFIYIPPQTLHNVRNPGSRTLRYIYVTAKVA